MENNEKPFYRGTEQYNKSTVFELLYDGTSRPICLLAGNTVEEREENAEFLLDLMNEYANRTVTPEDFKPKEAADAKP